MNATLPEIPTSLDDARIISMSQVESFTTCERKWLFSYYYQKQSKTMSRSLSIGVAGHEIVACYYQAIKAGMDRDEARLEAMKDLTQMFANDDYSPEILEMVYKLVTRYIAQDTIIGNAKILEVEQDFFLPINEEYWFGMRLDLLVEALRGRQQGRVLLIDHKFTYDFYTADDLALNPQMPKYVVPVRFAGYPVAEAYINQFRTRFKPEKIDEKMDGDLFQRSPVGIEQERVKNALAHQMKVSDRIIRVLKMDDEQAIDECIPVLNKMVCRNCPFQMPCQLVEKGYSPLTALGGAYAPKKSGFALTSKVEEDG